MAARASGLLAAMGILGVACGARRQPPSTGSPSASSAPAPTSSTAPLPVPTLSAATPQPIKTPTVEVCSHLIRPNCAPRSVYGGSFDHFVPLECSSLFEVRHMLALPQAPRALAPGIALMGPSVRAKRHSWSVVNYAAESPRVAPLHLAPKPSASLAVIADAASPLLFQYLGHTPKGHSRFGIWRLSCDDSCRQTDYLEVTSKAELSRMDQLGDEPKASLAAAIDAEESRQRRDHCMRSSAGCFDQGPPHVATTLGTGTSVPTPVAAPEGEVTLRQEPEGLYLTRTPAPGATEERWLLFSAERTQHLGPLMFTIPIPYGSGHLALLSSAEPATHAALLRFDRNSRLLGGPVRVATLAQGVWLAGCQDDRCLLTVAEGDALLGYVVRITQSEEPPCQSQTRWDAVGGNP